MTFLSSPWFLTGVLALGVWFLRPKTLMVEAGHTYRYVTDIVPPLPNDDAALRLGSDISDKGNLRVTVSTRSASYDVERSSPGTLTPGQLITSFEGSNLVLRSASLVS